MMDTNKVVKGVVGSTKMGYGYKKKKMKSKMCFKKLAEKAGQ